MKVIDSFSGKYAFLSNFFPVMIDWDADGIKVGAYYPSVEHAYQATKTFDRNQRITIMKAVTPGKAKQLGKKVTLRSDWEHVKVEVMYDLLCQKFAYQNLSTLLLATGDAKLVEQNTWGDLVWGVCNGKGKNLLGKLLLKVREEIRERNGASL